MPDNQLSLAIGKEGQNARLAAKLTGWKIDIKSESQANVMEDMVDDAVEPLEPFERFDEVEDLPLDEDDTL